MSRLKSLTMLLLGLAAWGHWYGFAADSQLHADERQRPHVLLIYADDQGSVDLNCYGATDLMTPNLDGLARRGVRFTQFYAAAPVCSPSRASLMTGKVPQRAGVPGNVSSQQGHDGMPSSQTTIAEVFRAAGYQTAHIGKWHLGYTPPTMPNGQGFDYSFGHMGGCIDNYSHFFYWNGPNRHDLWRDGEEVWHDGAFFPDLMVNELHQYVELHFQKPMFIYWAINVPHYPLQGTDKWRQHYQDLPAPRRQYAAFVSTMDEIIGQGISKLDDLGIRENTIIVFQSDHGHSTEERTFGGGGSAGPYRGAKFSLFEGGIRVPAILSWPQRIPGNQVRDQLATSCDWLPTLAQLCGLKDVPNDLDGRSLIKQIADEKAEDAHQEFHWQTGRNQWAVRQQNWKLIGNPRDTSNQGQLGPEDRLYLVNLEEDVGEKKNLAAEYPERVQAMQKLHEQWVQTWK